MILIQAEIPIWNSNTSKWEGAESILYCWNDNKILSNETHHSRVGVCQTLDSVKLWIEHQMRGKIIEVVE